MRSSVSSSRSSPAVNDEDLNNEAAADNANTTYRVSKLIRETDRKMFNILHLILSDKIKVNSIKSNKTFQVEPFQIRSNLTELGFFDPSVARLFDSYASLELTRSIWKLLRPFDPPQYTQFELQSALLYIIHGICTSTNTEVLFGVNENTVNYHMSKLRALLLPAVIKNTSQLKFFFREQ